MKMKQRTSGFSLIELLLIIVIIAVIAGIAIPSFSRWLPNYRLKMASRELYSNLQRTKAAAIKSNTEWRVYFDNSVNPGRYFLCSGPGINGAWDTPPALGGDDVVEMTFNLSNYEGVNYGNGSALKPEQERERKYMSSSRGNIVMVDEKAVTVGVTYWMEFD